VLQEVAESYRRSQGPGARAVVYADGLQGTEADTVRRMRVGQLDGSMLSIAGLSEIDRSVAALQYMPMMFRSWDEVDYVREALRPELEEKLSAKGFVVLLWAEAGWVQFFTTEAISHPEEFKRTRIFAWDGDPAQVSLMKSLGFRPVALPITDILPGLETGIIDTVPVTPMWALAGQLDTVTRYMLPINWVPVVGALVLRKRTFDSLRPDVREAVMAAARTGAGKLRAHRATLDEKSIRAMGDRGLTVQSLTPAIEQAWRDVAARAWPRLRGTLVPADTFDKVQSSLQTYRARKN
jgi:TRAP-type C4-dicarboxylate transport system substrate-binding protein